MPDTNSETNNAGSAPGDEDMQPELLTQEEAARYLRVSRTTFWRLVKGGKVKGYRIAGTERLRFKRDELLEPMTPAQAAALDRDQNEKEHDR